MVLFTPDPPVLGLEFLRLRFVILQYHPRKRSHSTGILTLQPTSQPKTKAAGLSRHQLAIFVCAFPIITIGTFGVWWNKHIRDHNHFTTWHGKLGLVSICWILVQIAVGGGSVWFGGAAFGGGMKAKLIWRYHRFVHIPGYYMRLTFE